MVDVGDGILLEEGVANYVGRAVAGASSLSRVSDRPLTSYADLYSKQSFVPLLQSNTFAAFPTFSTVLPGMHQGLRNGNLSTTRATLRSMATKRRALETDTQI